MTNGSDRNGGGDASSNGLLSLPGRFGEILVARGVIDEAQLDRAVREQKKPTERIGECLVRLGFMSDSEIPSCLAEQQRLELVDIKGMSVDARVRSLFSADYMTRTKIVPLEFREGRLRIATSNPGCAETIEDLRLLSGHEIEEVVASSDAIDLKIAECQQVTVESLVGDLEDGGTAAAPTNLHDIEVMASEPTVINLVNLIISSAVAERASDVHITPFEGLLELRYRIDGVLQEMPPPPRHLHAALISRIKIMADMNIAERYVPQDGRIQIQHGGHRVDIRVGSMPTVHGEGVVMRLLEKGGKIQTMVELGLDEARAQQLIHLVEKPHGIFLATGPTGSGKTTSLYSVLHSIYSVTKKILTIEDPVEYELPGVAQIPVRPSRGFTFATGLRAMLRQDPDVIMVGEIRDTETAEIAVRAALTGHLVFSTLHTNDAAGAVTRLVDMGVEPFLIASSLEGVLGQRLVRRICENCKRDVPVSDDVSLKLRAYGIELEQKRYFEGVGCDDCRQTGYRGRVGLYELLVLTPPLRDLILQRRSSGEIKARAVEDMVTLRQDGLLKAANGETTLDEVLRVAIDSD